MGNNHVFIRTVPTYRRRYIEGDVNTFSIAHVAEKPIKSDTYIRALEKNHLINATML